MRELRPKKLHPFLFTTREASGHRRKQVCAESDACSFGRKFYIRTSEELQVIARADLRKQPISLIDHRDAFGRFKSKGAATWTLFPAEQLQKRRLAAAIRSVNEGNPRFSIQLKAQRSWSKALAIVCFEQAINSQRRRPPALDVRRGRQ